MSQTVEAAVRAIMAARPTFRVGDRVRVTGAIAECQVEWINNPVRGHPDVAQGLTGKVVDYASACPDLARRFPLPQGHGVVMRLAAPVAWVHPTLGPLVGGAGIFAPEELELLEPATADTASGQEDES
jgi:hypothetical protein